MIFEVSLTEFQEKVIEASKTKPVLVDFWAEWCGPCRSLTPILESVIHDRQGDILLAKVNTESESELAQKFGIRGIPAVKLFINGEIKAEFQGALPKQKIEDFLAEHCPSQQENQLDQAKQLIDQMQIDEAVALVLDLLKEKPELASAHLLLAKAWLLNGKIEYADDQIGFCDPQNIMIHEMKEFITILEELSSLDPESSDESEKKIARAYEAFKDGDWELALEKLLEAVKANKTWNDAKAQKAMVAAFRVLGLRHPSTLKMQKALARALY